MIDGQQTLIRRIPLTLPLSQPPTGLTKTGAPSESFSSSLQRVVSEVSQARLLERLRQGQTLGEIKQELAERDAPKKIAKESLDVGVKAALRGAIDGAAISTVLAVAGGAGLAFGILGAATSLSLPLLAAAPVAALVSWIPSSTQLFFQVPLIALGTAGLYGVVAAGLHAAERLVVKKADSRALENLGQLPAGGPPSREPILA